MNYQCIISVILLILSTTPSFGQGSEREWLAKGMEAYANGAYKQSVEFLEKAGERQDSFSQYKSSLYIGKANLRLLKRGLPMAGQYQNQNIVALYALYQKASSYTLTKGQQKQVQNAKQELAPFLLQYGVQQFMQFQRQSSPNGLQNAVTALKAVVEIDPENHKAWDLLGQVEATGGNTKRAMACYRKSLENMPSSSKTTTDPSSIYVYYRLAFIQQKEQPDSAIALLKKGIALLEDLPSDTDQARKQQIAMMQQEMRRLLLHLSKQHETPAQADATFKELLKTQPDNAKWHLQHAQVLEELDKARAIGQYQKALELDSTMHQAHFNLGVLYYNELLKLKKETEPDKEAIETHATKALYHMEQSFAYEQESTSIQVIIQMAELLGDESKASAYKMKKTSLGL